MLSKCGLIALGLSLLQNTSFAQSINIVSTSVPFLRISPDARAGAMGDAGIALTPDAFSTFWNPAKAPFASSQSQVGLTYTPWLKSVAQDVYLATAAGYYKISDNQAVTGGVRYFNLGNIQFTNMSGDPLQQYRPREFSLEGGYSQKVSDYLSAGVTLRYINSSLANGEVGGTVYKAGTALAGDIGLYFDGQNEDGEGMTAGVTISNLGSKIGYTDDPNSKMFLPANLGLGVANTWALDETSKVTLTANVNHLLVPAFPTLSDNPTAAQSAKYTKDSADYYTKGSFSGIGSSFSNKAYQVSAGAEYGYNNQFFARAGYYWETKEAGNRRYFSAGVGLKYNVFDINFSYLATSGSGITQNPLSNTLRFGIAFDLGAIAGE